MIRLSKWDERFLALAEHVAQWSKDPSTKVGSVIVDSSRRVLGLGYNGFPRGVFDDENRLHDKPTKYKLVVHAEANAIMNSRHLVGGGYTMYATKSPCSDCVKLIVQCGIERVVSPEPSLDEPWATDAHFSHVMLREAKIAWTQIPAAHRRGFVP